MKQATRQEIASIMRATDVNLKPFFTVTFIKKDGSERVLNGRCGVRKHVKGVGLKFNPTSRGMIVVWEANESNRKSENDAGYRMVTIERIIRLAANGEIYEPID